MEGRGERERTAVQCSAMQPASVEGQCGSMLPSAVLCTFTRIQGSWMDEWDTLDALDALDRCREIHIFRAMQSRAVLSTATVLYCPY